MASDITQLSDEDILKNLSNQDILSGVGVSKRLPHPFQMINQALGEIPVAPFLKAREIPGVIHDAPQIAGSFLKGVAPFGFSVPMELAQKEAQRFPPGTKTALDTPVGQFLSSLFLQQPQTSGGKKAALAAGIAGGFLGAGGPVAREAVKSSMSAAEQVGGVAKGARTIFSPGRLAKLGQQAEQDLTMTVKGASPAFEAELRQLPGTVNVQQHIGNLASKLSLNPELQDAVMQAAEQAGAQGDTSLLNLLTSAKAATQATPLEVKQAVTTLEQAPSVYRALQAARSGSSQAGARFIQRAGATERDLLDTANAMEQQLVKAHPQQYPAILKKYQETRQAQKVFGQRLNVVQSENTIRGGLGSERMFELGKKTFPSGTMKQIKQVRTAQKVLPFGELSAGGQIIRRLFRH